MERYNILKNGDATKTKYDNTMNEQSWLNIKSSFETCKSRCRGEAYYKRNPYNKVPSGGKCQYIEWMSFKGGYCHLYFDFAQTRAVRKSSPGNLYKMTCSDSKYLIR